MIENIIETLPIVTCAIVYGDTKMNNPVAIVSCDKSVINSLNIKDDNELN